MEEMMYFMLIVACATFVVKTIVGWISAAKYEKVSAIRRAANEAEMDARRETRMEERVRRLEMYNFGDDD